MVLISRTEAKLDAVMREIKQKHGVKVQVIVVDFTEQNIYERIDSILSQLDVGILINNVDMCQSLRSLTKSSLRECQYTLGILNSIIAESFTTF